MGLYVFNWPIPVLGDWKDISIAHVFIIFKSEVSTFPIVIIFFRGCVPEMFLHHILSLIAYTFRENREFVFIIIVQFMMYHCANSSEGIEFIKCLSDIFCRVCE